MLYVFFMDFFMNIDVSMSVFFRHRLLEGREWGKRLCQFCFDTAFGLFVGFLCFVRPRLGRIIMDVCYPQVPVGHPRLSIVCPLRGLF